MVTVVGELVQRQPHASTIGKLHVSSWSKKSPSALAHNQNHFDCSSSQRNSSICGQAYKPDPTPWGGANWHQNNRNQQAHYKTPRFFSPLFVLLSVCLVQQIASPLPWLGRPDDEEHRQD